MKKDVEIWKNIVGYENLYQASNWGRVKSLKWGKERILKPVKDKYGYLQVVLYKDGKGKHFSVHRLVAEAFIPNDDPEHKTQVNHIREFEKTNNRVENLTWVTQKENINYGTRTERTSKPVVGIDPKNWEVVAEFPSTKEAGRNGFDQSAVAHCCRGEYKTYKGLIWRYRQ